jgi:hypothetical protein
MKTNNEETLKHAEAAVEQVNQAKSKLYALEEMHPDVFKQYHLLKEDYRICAEEAERLVRSCAQSVGDFKIIYTKHAYDAHKLLQLVGLNKFKEVGGTIEILEKLHVDTTTFEKAVAEGKVSQDVVKQVRDMSVALRVPKLGRP